MRNAILALLVIVGMSHALFRFDQPAPARASVTPPLVIETATDRPPAPADDLPQPQSPPTLPQRIEILELVYGGLTARVDKQHEVSERIVGMVEALAEVQKQAFAREPKEPGNDKPGQLHSPNCPDNAPTAKQPDSKPQPVAQQPDKPVKRIYFVTRDDGSCRPCIDWKRNEWANAEREGYEVVPIPAEGGPVPRFRVAIGTEYADLTGYMTHARLKEAESAIMSVRALKGQR